MTAASQSIGSKLKAQREKKQLSIDDVHLRLRIHPDALRRLEENQFTQWPGGGIYVRGFLKQYTDFLGLNTAEILVEYDQLGLKATKVDLSPIAPTQPKRPQEKEKSTKEKPSVSPEVSKARALEAEKSQKAIVKWVGIAVVVVVALWLGTSAVRAIGSAFGDFRTKQAANSAKKKEARDAARAQKAKVEEKKNEDRKAAAKGSEAPDAAGFINSPAQGNFPKIKVTETLGVALTAQTDIWMRVTTDGQVAFESILKKGESESWNAEKSVEFKFGRPEGADLTVNGYHIGTPGNGKIVRIEVTRDGIRQVQ